jgi:MOSC domain-containing protein YiiM
MDPRDRATLVTGQGIVGNADQGGTRQVTILAQERWAELMAQTSGQLDPRERRANLLVSGVSLEQSRGRLLRIGTSRLRVAGETRPCDLMNRAQHGLRDAMADRWGGGVFAEVITAANIQIGDEVAWDDQDGGDASST